jgi:hypothetical protein
MTVELEHLDLLQFNDGFVSQFTRKVGQWLLDLGHCEALGPGLNNG